MQVGFAAPVQQTRQAGHANRHAHGAHAPRASKAVVDDDAHVCAAQCGERCAQPRRARIGIGGQEQHAFAPVFVDVHVGPVDACIGEHETALVFDDDHTGHGTQHFARFGKHDLHDAGILVAQGRKLERAL